MVMYKQNQGLMAKGTVGTQTTGGTLTPKKKSYSLQSDQGGFQLGGVGQALSSIGKGVGSFVGALGQAGVLGGQSRGNIFTYSPGAFAGTQPTPAPQPVGTTYEGPRNVTELTQALGRAGIGVSPFATYEELLSQYNNLSPSVKGAPLDGGAMRRRPTGQAGATYYLTPETPAARDFASGTTYGQSSVLGPDYRPPAQSAWANFENPFTAERQRLLEAQAIQQAEEQSAVTARRLGSQLAGAGLMSGGGTGLSSSMAQQLALQTEGQRSQALRDIALQVPAQRAELEARRAAGLDAWAPTAFNISERIARQPGELAQLEAAGRLTAAQADIASIDALIKADPEVKAATKRKVLAESGMSDAEYEAAMRLLATTDPNKWWNHPAWGIVGGVVDNALKISQAFKNFTTAGK